MATSVMGIRARLAEIAEQYEQDSGQSGYLHWNIDRTHDYADAVVDQLNILAAAK